MIQNLQRELKRKQEELRQKLNENPEPPSKAMDSDSVHSSELERLDRESSALRLRMI